MARVGTKTLLHHVLHKFNKSNPTSLVSRNFSIMGVALTKYLSITWYLRDYEAKISMECYNYPNVYLKIGCLRIVIEFGYVKYVRLIIKHRKKAEIVLALTSPEIYNVEICVQILSLDIIPKVYEELRYSYDQFDSWRKIIEQNTTGETLMMLCEEAENMTDYMIRIYDDCYRKGKVN
jgi:hypothetical protein